MTQEIVIAGIPVKVTEEQAKELALLLLRCKLQRLNLSQIRAISKVVDELYPSDQAKEITNEN